MGYNERLDSPIINGTVTGDSGLVTSIPFVSQNHSLTNGYAPFGTITGYADFYIDTMSANIILMKPFVLYESIDVDAYTFYCNASSSVNLNLCIYNVSTSTNLPTGDPIANSTTGSVDLTSSGQKIATLPDTITLTPGVYYLAAWTDGTANLYCFGDASDETYAQSIIGYDTSASPHVHSSYASVLRQTGTYSTTFPTIGTMITQGFLIDFPIVCFRRP